MPRFLTEDEVRDNDKAILGFDEKENEVKQGTGQLTTFKKLGFPSDKKPDGWYIQNNKSFVSIILETKNSGEDLSNEKCIKEIKDNCSVLLNNGYTKVIGLLHNGYKVKGFYNNETIDVPDEIQNKKYYIDLINDKGIDKKKIFNTTKSINDNLHVNFGVKNLYHRMIFTACALVAERYGARLKTLKDREFSLLHTQILSTINKSLEKDKKQNEKLQILEDIYAKIDMNYTGNQDAINGFIDDVCEISDCINSSGWQGEDVMGIFFNEFNRYKKKSDAGQVFTPEHITSFMYRLIEVTANDYVGDFCCGSGGFLVKSMAKMMKEAGGYNTKKAQEIRASHLFGIEWDKEIYALACANMLIHKDGKTNLDWNDMRSDSACEWVRSKPVTKVLMNPPFERKYGCLRIVENVLDSVKAGTKCAFILPDKKLEKEPESSVKRILSNHRITKIIKLPEKTFNEGVTTSIFIFEAGIPQDNKEIFTCYIEDDGLETVKNQGRQDVKNRWQGIEDKWLDIIHKQSGNASIKWISPSRNLSYQMPEKPFQVFEEDFRKSIIDYLMYKQNIDAKEFYGSLVRKIMYEGDMASKKDSIIITMRKKDNHNETD